MLTGVDIVKNKFKYTNLLDASIACISLNNYDEKKIIMSSKRKLLLYNLNSKKITKKFSVKEKGNIIGTFKKNK